MPSLESPWIPTSPLPCSLSKKVNSSKPVTIGVVSIKHLESVHDQIVLILTGGLRQEPIVLDTALHGLVPIDRAIVSASSAARVVVTTRGVVTLGVTVPVVGAADSATASSVTEATVVDLRVTEDVVTLVGSLGPVDPPIVGVTAGCGLGGHLWQDLFIITS